MTVSLPPVTACSSPTERTKTRLLELIKRHGPLTAQDLSSHLEVSIPAARRHLCDLEEAGLLALRIERPGGRGRPQHVYALTEQGESTFPKAYASLCIDILRHVEALYGEGAVMEVVDARNRQLADVVRDDLARAPNLAERAEIFRQYLQELGFDPVLEREGDHLYLIQRNCPNLAVARQFKQLCLSECAMYTEVLGFTVTPETRIVCGQGVCRYRLA